MEDKITVEVGECISIRKFQDEVIEEISKSKGAISVCETAIRNLILKKPVDLSFRGELYVLEFYFHMVKTAPSKDALWRIIEGLYLHPALQSQTHQVSDFFMGRLTQLIISLAKPLNVELNDLIQWFIEVLKLFILSNNIPYKHRANLCFLDFWARLLLDADDFRKVKEIGNVVGFSGIEDAITVQFAWELKTLALERKRQLDLPCSENSVMEKKIATAMRKSSMILQKDRTFSLLAYGIADIIQYNTEPGRDFYEKRNELLAIRTVLLQLCFITYEEEIDVIKLDEKLTQSEDVLIKHYNSVIRVLKERAKTFFSVDIKKHFVELIRDIDLAMENVKENTEKLAKVRYLKAVIETLSYDVRVCMNHKVECQLESLLNAIAIPELTDKCTTVVNVSERQRRGREDYIVITEIDELFDMNYDAKAKRTIGKVLKSAKRGAVGCVMSNEEIGEPSDNLSEEIEALRCARDGLQLTSNKEAETLSMLVNEASVIMDSDCGFLRKTRGYKNLIKNEINGTVNLERVKELEKLRDMLSTIEEFTCLEDAKSFSAPTSEGIPDDPILSLFYALLIVSKVEAIKYFQIDVNTRMDMAIQQIEKTLKNPIELKNEPDTKAAHFQLEMLKVLRTGMIKLRKNPLVSFTLGVGTFIVSCLKDLESTFPKLADECATLAMIVAKTSCKEISEKQIASNEAERIKLSTALEKKPYLLSEDNSKPATNGTVIKGVSFKPMALTTDYVTEALNLSVVIEIFMEGIRGDSEKTARLASMVDALKSIVIPRDISRVKECLNALETIVKAESKTDEELEIEERAAQIVKQFSEDRNININ